MAELPPDCTLEELEALRAPRRPPFRPYAPTVRRSDGSPPMFAGHGTARQARAFALVDTGEWRLACPFCPGVGVGLDRFGVRLAVFVCPLCQNAAAGGRPVETLWPTAAHTRAITAILNARDVQNRNWVPWESTDALRAENEAHGLPPDGPLIAPATP